MPYRENLPEGCPPSEAIEISAPTVVYRLVENVLPVNDDFRSQRALAPHKNFSVTECIARGLSVNTNVRDTRNLLKLRVHRSKEICEVRLDTGAGYIQPTGGGSHHTWWSYADFDILSNCSVVKP